MHWTTCIAWISSTAISNRYVVPSCAPSWCIHSIFQRNVLVDRNGVARLGGLGSAFSLSLPASWSEVAAARLFCGIAPELVSPHTFGLVHARTTKATDMFAFGMLAWEVSRIFRSSDFELIVFSYRP